jgi:hypothetical protein
MTAICSRVIVVSGEKLKEEVREAEKIRKNVYNILRQEQWERQPRRAQNMEG